MCLRLLSGTPAPKKDFGVNSLAHPLRPSDFGLPRSTGRAGLHAEADSQAQAGWIGEIETFFVERHIAYLRIEENAPVNDSTMKRRSLTRRACLVPRGGQAGIERP